MKLIDADATKRRVEDTFFDTLIPCVNRALDDSPTVDAVPVVRCAQCKHFKRNLENDTYCSSVNGLTDPQEDDFCSYGERRADDAKTD